MMHLIDIRNGIIIGAIPENKNQSKVVDIVESSFGLLSLTTKNIKS